MKKILAMGILVFVAYYSQAQTAKGNMMIGGSFGFGSTSYEGAPNKYNTFSFSPSFGYFVSDNLAVGSGLSFTHNSTSNGTNQSTDNSFGLSPFVRYYKFTSNEKFAFFAQAIVGLTSYRNETGTSVTKGSRVSLNIAPGFSYFFTNHWAMDLSLSGFSIFGNNPNGNGNNSSTVQLDLSLSPSIGLRYHFGK